MGFTAESGGSPRPGAANLLATIFKTPETTPQSSSTSERKSFFRFSLPSSPTPSPRMPKAIPSSTDIIDEFAGISFSTVLQSYLEEPTQTPSTPAEALKRTPGGRLEDAVATATDLLDRVYTAYRARTSSLGDIIGEIDVQREEIASHKILNENLKAQLNRVVTKEQEASDAQTDRLNEQERRLKDLEAELSQERRKREAVEEELWLARRSKCKRTSAGSDSGFESDVDSILSRSDMRGSIIISPAEDADETGSEMGHDCESCHHQAAAVGAETKSPTPLRETWRPENLTVSKPGVWGFFKGRQQQTQQQQNWDTRYSGDAETVRAENRWLRERVRELEKAVEGALDAIAGRGI
ncbi:hypothetical protein BDD12DRAFT_249948 [Trichophaea hybrida]|nr:hypothetical protein BDD12DRAFT_249948 [Trichophaea hybrida]